MRIIQAPRERAIETALRRVYATRVVLDVGPGIQPQQYFPARTHICVEAHQPYVRRMLQDRAGDPRMVYLNGTWQEVLRHLPDDSVDTAFALDLIEHLEKEDGYGLLREMARIARHQVVIFTPLGLYPQHYDEGEPDAWGMDGGHWQTHRSGWTPDDLEQVGGSWDAVVSADFHQWDQHGNRLAEPFGAFWGIQTLSPLPAGARDAWTASRGTRLAQASAFHWGRLRRFARSPVTSGRRFVRRLAGKPV